jgi:hypothetical protein
MVVSHDTAASPGDDKKEETTDYADYTDFFVFSSRPFACLRGLFS